MLSQTPAGEVLKGYVNFAATVCSPLHAQALSLQFTGELSRIDPGLTLCGMWTPYKYRDQLIAHALALPEEWVDPPRPGPVATLGTEDLAVLARLGAYDDVVRFGEVASNPIAAALILAAQEHMRLHDLAERLPRELPSYRLTEFSLHAVEVLSIARLTRTGQLKEASERIAAAYKEVSKWRNISEWLIRFAEARLASLDATILYETGLHKESVDIWLKLADSLSSIPADGRVEQWASKDFARHRMSRVARYLISEFSAGASEVTSAVLDIDPYDARAWQLHGKALIMIDEDAALQAFELAAELDPTVQVETAALTAKLCRRHKQARSHLQIQRALNTSARDMEFGGLCSRHGAPLHGALEKWASQPPEVRPNWLEALYRPVIELAPGIDGPLFAQTPLAAIERLREVDQTKGHWIPNVQRAVMPSLRREICRIVRKPEFAVASPETLAPESRSEGWATLVNELAGWKAAGEAKKTAMLAVLLSIGMHPYARNLLKQTEASEGRLTDNLSYIEAFCEYILFAETGWFGYKPIAFANLAQRARLGSRAAFMASLVCGVHFGKVEKVAQPTEMWLGRAQTHLSVLAEEWPTRFAVDVWQSRWHRANAFLPFLRNDASGAIAELNLALDWNDQAAATTLTEAMVQRENRQTILQTICKTALHFHLSEIALDHARLYVDSDPLDVGGWLELGNVYFVQQAYSEAAEAFLTAALLGPPGDRIGRYMAGEAAARVGVIGDAVVDFLASLTADQEGESPRRRLAELRLEGTMFGRLRPLVAKLNST